MKIIYIIIIFLFGCSNNNSSNINGVNVLATIGDRIITISDFIRRSEYNVRPTYCNGSSIEEKQIILNSLIAEKLIALESKSNISDMNYQLLQGRKEQKMREVLYNRDIYNRVKIDSLELNIAYGNSRKDFTISYITLPEKQILTEIKKSVEDSIYTFEEAVKSILNIDKIPTRQINYNELTSEDIYQEFFSKNIQIGQIFGPVFMGGYFSIFRVDDWIERRSISPIQISQETSSLKLSVKKMKAHTHYRRYINSLMQGKTLELHAENFEKLVMNIQTDLKTLSLENPEIKIRDVLYNNKYSINLSTISDKDWTMCDINNLISHDPMSIDSRQNGNVLKNLLKKSIIEKIESFYITQDAYVKDIDEHFLVNQEVTIWSDYIKSTQFISEIIRTSGIPQFEGNDNMMFDKLLDPLFDSLVVKYSDIIHVDENYFADIDFTSIDMHVFYKEQSHSLVVPIFPITTTRRSLDYIK